MPRKAYCPKCKQDVTILPVGTRGQKDSKGYVYGIHWKDSHQTERCENSEKRA